MGWMSRLWGGWKPAAWKSPGSSGQWHEVKLEVSHLWGHLLCTSVVNPVHNFIDDLDDGTKSALRKFADDRKLRESDMPGGCTATQRGLNRLEKLAGMKNMKLSKKAKSPGPEEEQLQAPVHAGTISLESSLAEKDLWSWWTPSSTWISNIPSLQRRLMVSWAAFGKVLLGDWRREFCFIQHHWV